MINEERLKDIEESINRQDGTWRALTIRSLVTEVRRLREALTETRLHLKFVSNIALRLGPKAHNTHREEALALLDGTVRDAEAVYEKWAS